MINNCYSLTKDVTGGAHETRQANLYHITRTKTKSIDKLPLINFPKIWNSWYTKLDVNSSRNVFKRKIKSIFLDSYPAVVNCNNPRCPDCHGGPTPAALV